MLQGSNSICWATGSNKSDMWINVDVLESVSSSDVDIQSLSLCNFGFETQESSL